MRLRTLWFISFALTVLPSWSRPLQADTVLTAYGGVVTEGDLPERRTTYGLALAFQGDGLFGFEIDGGYTPDFYGEEDSGLGKNNVTTLMGSVLLGFRVGDDARVYGAAGGGLLKSRVDDPDDFFDVSQNDFGINVGGGLQAFFGDRLGARADIRYFRNLSEPDPDDPLDLDLGDFDYWRVPASPCVSSAGGRGPRLSFGRR